MRETPASQGSGTWYGDRDFKAGVTPLRLTRAPSGVGVGGGDRTRRAYAGPFEDLRVSGAVRGPGMRATASYRFTPRWIGVRWTLRSAGAVDAAVTFPSWGRGADVVVVLRDGRTEPLGPSPVALSRVASLHVVSERSGYRVLPLSRPEGAAVRLVTVRPQAADPNPGPAVEVELQRGRHASFAARIVTDGASRR
jgi:hypothetical protein